MVELFIIADDFTGALDTACQFGKHGIPTVVFSGRKMPSLPDEIRVAVVNTDTRHKSPPEARAIVSELAEVCRIQGFPRILKKIDSALRGNWGTELEALLWAGLSDRAYLLPAFPDGGRITQQGIQWLNGVEIAKTAYGRDPFNPVLSSRLSDHLSEKWLLISEGEPLADAPGIQIVDASRSSQLEARCRELPRHGTLILAGCAGLAAALAGEMAQGMESCAAPVPPSERLLIVSGSLHPLSRSQTRWAVQRGIPLITLSPGSVGAVSDAFRSSRTVILETSGQLDSSREPEYAARQLAQAVQQIYHKEGPLTLAVFGGDTLLQIVPPIFREGLYPTDEISPGIPVSVARDRTGQPVTLISKSGGFGPEDVIGQIINYVFSDNLGGNDMDTV